MSAPTATGLVTASVDVVLMRQAGLPLWAIEHRLVTEYGLEPGAAVRLATLVGKRLVRATEIRPPALGAVELYGDCLPLRPRPDPNRRS